MTHLRIELPTTGIELVSNSVIEKLYNLAVGGDLDASSNLLGRLSVDGTYLEYIDELEDLFDELYITANKIYINFADNAVKSALMSVYGDGIGITSSDVSTTYINKSFKNNTSIHTFDELSLFTGVNYLTDQLFSGCTNLTSIDTSRISKVGNNCITDTKITHLDLSNLTTISGPNAFAGNTLLTSVDFGQNTSITSFGSTAFSGCTSLATITIPTSITSISNYCFYHDSNLTTVNGTSNVTSIGLYAFENCSKLTTLDISAVTSLGYLAFYGCSKLNNITLNSGLTSIPNNCFKGCSTLSSIDLSNITSVGSNAFEGCTSLTTVDLSNVTTIGQGAFFDDSNLTTLTGLNNCITLGLEAFRNCTKLKLSNTDLYNVLTISGGRDGWLFCNYRQDSMLSNVTSADLYLPNLKSLGFGAFYKQSLIETINLPGLTSLHLGATFAGCTSLREVKSLGNITEMSYTDTGYGNRYGILANCTSLQKVSLPDNLIELSSEMFRNDTSLSCIYRNCNKYMYLCISSSDAGLNVTQVMQDITPTLEQQSQQWWTQKSSTFNIGSYYTSAEVGSGFIRFGTSIGTSEIDLLEENSIISITDSHYTNTTTYFKKVCGITKDSFQSITRISNYTFCKCNSLTNKVLYFPNVTMLGSELTFANTSNSHIYLPGNVEFKAVSGTNKDIVNSAPAYSHGAISGFVYLNRDEVPNGYSKIKTLYFKNISAFPAGYFYGVDIKNLIINNTTVPSLTQTSNTQLINNIANINTDMFVRIYNVDNIYVPDSALSDYQNSSLFSNVVSKLKPLSQCPRITVQEAENGSDGIIEEYM